MTTNSMPNFPVWPVIEHDEIEAATQVLRSGKINYWTGSQGRDFERAFANYIGCEYAIALANGTLALELALKAIKLQPGAEVIVPSKTFIATASAVVACNGTPIVADVDLHTQNITLDTIKPLVTTKTQAIIVVHLGGLSCDMDPIVQFAQENNIKVIEDCAQSHGAQYKGKMAGNLADVSVFSFCQDKIMTTGGEGGMLVTNNSEIWRRAWEYKDHGKDYEAVHDASNPTPGFKWVHNSFGSNYRLSEIQSSIGLVQLSKLSAWIELRQRNARFLLNGLKNIPAIFIFNPSADYQHAYYKFYFHIDQSKLKSGWSRDKISAALNEMGIPCREGVCSEIYREEAFIQRGFGPKNRLPNAQVLSSNSLILPVHHTLELAHMQIMLDGIKQVMERATQ